MVEVVHKKCRAFELMDFNGGGGRWEVGGYRREKNMAGKIILRNMFLCRSMTSYNKIFMYPSDRSRG